LGIDATDAVLVERARAGDDRAWRLLVDRYAGLVYSVPRRHRLGNDQCDDVFQVTFTSLWRSLGRLRDVATLPKWLITTAYRESLRVRRTSTAPASDPGTDHADPASAPAEDLVRGERQHALHLALTRLGGKCEPLLRALFLDPRQPNYQAISQRLGMPVGSIGPVRARCLRKLLELFREVEGIDEDRAQ
jgi:RNA polymerase sigma factor (sigma-70 family)